MMQPTRRWCATLTWPCGINARMRQRRLFVFWREGEHNSHVGTNEANVSVTVNSITGCLEGKLRWSLAKTWLHKRFIPLQCGMEQDTTYFFILDPYAAEPSWGKNVCFHVCVPVCGLLLAPTSSWWVHLTLPHNMGGCFCCCQRGDVWGYEQRLRGS